MTQTTLTFEQRVDDRISALLARCDRIRRGTDIGRPTKFNRAGERHARQVAANDSNSHHPQPEN